MTLLRTQLGYDPARPPAASAPHAARRLRRRPGQPGLPLRGGAGPEGGLLRAARLHLRRARPRARRPAGRGERGTARRRAPRRPPVVRTAVPAAAEPVAEPATEQPAEGAVASAEPALALVGAAEPGAHSHPPRRRLARGLIGPASSPPQCCAVRRTLPARTRAAATRWAAPVAGLLDGAARAFAEQGLRGATMQSIARCGGGGQGDALQPLPDQGRGRPGAAGGRVDRLTALAAERPADEALALLADELAGHPVLRRLRDDRPGAAARPAGRRLRDVGGRCSTGWPARSLSIPTGPSWRPLAARCGSAAGPVTTRHRHAAVLAELLAPPAEEGLRA